MLSPDNGPSKLLEHTKARQEETNRLKRYGCRSKPVLQGCDPQPKGLRCTQLGKSKELRSGRGGAAWRGPRLLVRSTTLFWGSRPKCKDPFFVVRFVQSEPSESPCCLNIFCGPPPASQIDATTGTSKRFLFPGAPTVRRAAAAACAVVIS